MRLCSLNTSTKIFKIEKWKAGVNNFRLDLHKSPFKRNKNMDLKHLNTSKNHEICFLVAYRSLGEVLDPTMEWVPYTTHLYRLSSGYLKPPITKSQEIFSPRYRSLTAIQTRCNLPSLAQAMKQQRSNVFPQKHDKSLHIFQNTSREIYG
jgi:hypothetical protein